MRRSRKFGSGGVLIALAGIVLGGCAIVPHSVAATVERTAPAISAVGCGTFGIIESVPGEGASTRQGALEAMVRGHQAIVGTPQAEDLRSTPEDVLLTLRAALRALPDVEREVAPRAPITVPAVAEDGTELGDFLIVPNGDDYVISSYTVTHVDGVPCPSSTG